MNRDEATWKLWTNETRRKFDNLTQCLVDQYSEFEVAGEFLNGTITLTENLADNGNKTNKNYRRTGKNE